jgi:spore coat polysaccharide biosynthesis protein SpsF
VGAKIAAIVQARTASTRLPKKVLLELPYGSGITVLEQVIRRLKKSKLLDEIIVATTTSLEDDPIVEISKAERVKYFRGSEKNVLERYYLCAKENKVDIVVRITSDCPCVDWNVVDMMIKEHLQKQADYTSNTLQRTFPHGLDVEVISFEALEKAYRRASKDFEKEHVCPYIHTINRKGFKIVSVKAPSTLTAPDIRITLDVEEDYALLCAVFDYLYPQNNYFQATDIINLFKEKPWLKLINKKVLQKKFLQTLEEELEEAKKLLELQDLKRAKEIIERWRN